MDHMGIEYRILHTASPTGFKWIVVFGDGRIKMGDTFNRVSAIRRAVTAIEKALQNKVQPDA